MPEENRIPALDLKAQYASIREEVDAAIAAVLASGMFVLGEAVQRFEADFADYCGVAQAVGVNSGTAAIQLALLACGIGRGDEVITVSHTSVATVAAIELTGARPVLVDIDPRRYSLDPGQVESAITPRTRAILPVHLYGCPADLAPLLETARARGLRLIEDCAQAHGASYHGRRTGSWGDLAAFSFYPTKNLGAYGDGGAVLTGDPELAERLRLLRQYGWKERNVSSLKGLNTRLDDLQAAVLGAKLRHLDAWNARRRDLARRYTELLAGSGLVLPVEPEGTWHVYHQYVIRCTARNRLQSFLKARGIASAIHYPLPVHLQPAYADLGCKPGDLPASEAAAREVLSLPLYPEMTDEAVESVAGAVLEFLRGEPAARL
jgi:dTDP-4-amino-4,6-dideoxygalactose transaminase